MHPLRFITSAVLASLPTLEIWRRERERIADRKAALASGRPVDPVRAPRKVVPLAPKVASPSGASMFIKRAPKRLSGPVPFGYQRVECQLNNVDFQETLCVTGDQFDVMKEVADYVLRGAAFTLVAVPENVDEAPAMSGSSPNLNVTLGTVNGTPIVANLNGGNFQKRYAVTIGSNSYVRNPPKDFPDANPGNGNQWSYTAFSQTIPGGTIVTLFEAEAVALVNAGAATLGAIVSNG